MHKIYFISLFYFECCASDIKSFYFDTTRIEKNTVLRVTKCEVQLDLLLLQKLKLPELDVVLLSEVLDAYKAAHDKKLKELEAILQQCALSRGNA